MSDVSEGQARHREAIEIGRREACWPAGMIVTPRDKTHHRYGDVSELLSAWPSGHYGIKDRDCVLRIRMSTEITPAYIIWEPASKWEIVT